MNEPKDFTLKTLVTEKTYDEFAAAASDSNRSVSSLLRVIVEKYLNKRYLI